MTEDKPPPGFRSAEPTFSPWRAVPFAHALERLTGAARHEHAPYLDAMVWVASDEAIARERGIARDGDGAEAIAFWDEWAAAERPFLEVERPWERADLVVSGTPAPDLPEAQVLVGA